MSSSRVQISFTGTPGICLAICTTWRHVVGAAAAAESAAEMHLVEVALAIGMPEASDAAASAASAFCVGPHTSSLSAV